MRHFPERSWTVVAFPCFTVVKSFTSWFALLLLFFLRFFQSHYTVPLSSFFSLFQAPVDVVVHLNFSDPSGSNLFFLSSLLLWHRLRISAVIQGCCFFLTMFAKDLTGCFSHCSVEGGDHSIHVCIFIIHDGEKCKLPTYHSLADFQHIGIFQLFEVKLESCVFWLADSFQMKVEGHHQQVVVSSNICSWKTSCSGTVHSWSEAFPH